MNTARDAAQPWGRNTGGGEHMKSTLLVLQRMLSRDDLYGDEYNAIKDAIKIINDVNKPKCRDCVYYTGNKTSLGIECMHPQRTFRSKKAHFRQPDDNCKHWEDKYKYHAKPGQ